MPHRTVIIKVPDHENQRLVAVYLIPHPSVADATELQPAGHLAGVARLAERRYMLVDDVLATFVEKHTGTLVYARTLVRNHQLLADSLYELVGAGKYTLAKAL